MDKRPQYRFAGFTLDLERMAVTDGEGEVYLRPKAFDVLRALVEHAGRVVTKDELVATAWPDVIVNDDALAQCIRDIRKALGDKDQHLIKTVQRRGYMFVAQIEPPIADGRPPAATTRTKRAVALGAAAIMLILAVAWWSIRGETPSDPPFDRDPRLTIAVLPFNTASEDRSSAWLGEGLAEDIMTALSRFRDLAVVARNSSFKYGGGDLDPAEIRRDLNADFLLQGTVRTTGEKLRLAVQLVDLRTGVNRWAEQFDRPLDEVFAVQDAITDEVAALLAGHARDATAARVQGSPPQAMEVYELALRARKALLTFTGDGTFEAERLIERAISADPDYAVAWELLARVLVQIYIQPYDERRGSPTVIAQARAAAERSVALDPIYSSARATLAGLLARAGEYDAALEQLHESLRLNPNDSTAIATYADILSRAGLHQESLEAWDAISRRDPFGSPLADALRARASILGGMTEEGYMHARNCAARAPSLQPCLVFLTVAAAASGRQEEAETVAARLLEVSPGFTIGRHLDIVPYRKREDHYAIASHLRAAGVPD